jgi:hypothetical protein
VLRCHGYVPIDAVDIDDLGDGVLDADRIQQFGKRDRGLAEVDLIIADADVVIGIAVDDEDFGVAGRSADLFTLARGADGRPQAGKAGA